MTAVTKPKNRPPKKLQDARKKGDVSKSKDVTSAASLLTILLLSTVALPTVGAQLTALVQASFDLIQEPFGTAMPLLGKQAAMTLVTIAGLVMLPVAVMGAWWISSRQGPS